MQRAQVDMSSTVPGLAIRRDWQLHRDHGTAADAGGEHDFATERDGDRARDAAADTDVGAASRRAADTTPARSIVSADPRFASVCNARTLLAIRSAPVVMSSR